jgi:hypothetical protein
MLLIEELQVPFGPLLAMVDCLLVVEADADRIGAGGMAELISAQYQGKASLARA